MSGPVPGADGVVRCPWAVGDPLYEAYHDTEWGRGGVEDHRLFEKIVLEGFQAGLSWITILRKREHFREVFAGFAPEVVAGFDESRIETLLQDPGIIRHRGKIDSAINNAAMALDLIDEFGSIAAYVWPWARSGPAPRRLESLPSQTETSEELSKDLKRRGWRFVGPTTIYAFMQARGLVNDHLEGCAMRELCEQSRLPILERYVRS